MSNMSNMSNRMGSRDSVSLHDEDIAKGFWQQDATHFSHPLSPLFQSFLVPTTSEGTRRAFDSVKAPMIEFRPRIRDGYYYHSVVPFPGDPEVRQQQYQERLKELAPHHLETFQRMVDEDLFPIYRRLDELASEDLDPNRALQELHWLMETSIDVWDIHFRIVLPRFAVTLQLETLYREMTGDEDPRGLYRLFEGLLNKSLETDRELGRLAAFVVARPELREAFQEQSAEALVTFLPSWAPAREFWSRLQATLSEYGYRASHSHEFVDPTWIEDPTPALAIIKAYAGTGYDFDAHLAALAADRERAVAQFFKTYADHPRMGAFRDTFDLATRLWNIDEDHHFYLDAMFPAHIRPFLMNVGSILVRRSQVQRSDDVFFLYLDELERGLEDAAMNYHTLVAERRDAYAHQQAVVPPPFFGKPPADGEPDLLAIRVFGANKPEAPSAAVIQGFAASSGRYTGKVRILRGQEDFGRLEPGEVLVCRTTTPVWTVLFPVAGAIVTDAGGILSHAATVAREYGRPCVVGSRTATHTLHDGDLVTVDGDQGTVVLAH